MENMISKHARKAAALALASFTLALNSPAQSQTHVWPERTVILVVGYAAGGTGDFVARVISGPLGKALGQNVIVENRPGGSGAIGAKSVVTGGGDGYRLLVGQTGEISINQHRIKNLGYDPQKDLKPVAMLSSVPLALVVPKTSPYGTAKELIDAIRSNAKGFNIANSGVGTPAQFAAALLKDRTKGNLTQVPYNGAGPAMNDIIAGHVDIYFPGLPAAVPHMKAGTAKVLAVSTAKRAALAPEIPSVAEVAGIPDFDFALWAGLFSASGVPDAVIQRLNKEITAIMQDPAVRARMATAGAEIPESSIAHAVAFTLTLPL